VSVAACDVGDRAPLAALIEKLPAERPLSAVVHAAGVGALASVDALGAPELQTALAAKAEGALHLHELTRERELSAFVLCSSIAGTFGTGQQAAYAAANAFLDALADERRACGLPASAIAWGPWADTGIAAAVEQAGGELLRRQGLTPMAPARALAPLHDALDRGAARAVVADVDWALYAPIYASARPRPLIEDLPEVGAALRGGDDEDSAAGAELRRRLAGRSQEDRAQLLLELVCAEVAEVLGAAAAGAVDATSTFSELGFDSLRSVELRNRLTVATGLRLPAALVFNYPTPAAVAEHLLARLVSGAEDEPLAVLAELQQLESAVTSASMDERERGALRERLRALTGALDGPAETAETTVADGIRAASAEEIIDFIDRELGAV
jgi:acyl carrier protein/short-subunit dehydrogenase